MRPSLTALAFASVATFLPAQSPRVPTRTLHFEPAPEAGRFDARAPGVLWRFEGATMQAHTDAGVVAIAVVGARDGSRVEPLRPRTGTSHYYLGNDPARWRTFVPHYDELRTRHALPGVDLVQRAAGTDLEFDIELASGAIARDLALSISGGGEPQLRPDGTLAVPLGDDALHLRAPKVFQRIGDRTREVPCRYALDGRTLRFHLGDHDPQLPLTIDPVVTFATLLGGSLGQETVAGVHLSAQGDVIVTGRTQASNFPLQNALPYTFRNDIGFVTKFDANGALVFSTFFGGTSGFVRPVDVGTDPSGQVVVGGNTTSPDLPTTGGALQPTLVGGGDWFFVDFLANGTLVWCTYFGGPGSQTNMRCLHVLDVLLGSVLGVGVESAFPFQPNAYSQLGNLVCGGVQGGNVLWCASACGFSGTPNAVDVTAQGHICITGTISGTGSGLPTAATSFQPATASPGGIDGFVFVFTGQQNSLVFATYFGGTGNDQPRAIHAGTGPGTVVVTIAGDTSSTDLPVHAALQPTKGAGQDGFVSRLDGLTQSLAFSTYLGGSDPGESISGVGVDQNGYTIVAGQGNSADLPFRNPIKLPNPASNRDAVLWRLSPTGALDWCTNYGGGGSEVLTDLSVAPTGPFAIAGHTAGVNWPSTPGALPSAFVDQDAFVATFDPRSIVSYGAGSAGSGGFVPVLAGGGPTAPGTTTRLQIHDGLGQTLGALVAGFGRVNLPLFGGTQLVVPLSSVTVVLNGPPATLFAARGGGYLHRGFAIPNDAGLVGVVIDWQAAFLDPQAQGGVSLSNGVELVVQ